jgi:hypothetical protein
MVQKSLVVRFDTQLQAEVWFRGVKLPFKVHKNFGSGDVCIHTPVGYIYFDTNDKKFTRVNSSYDTVGFSDTFLEQLGVYRYARWVSFDAVEGKEALFIRLLSGKNPVKYIRGEFRLLKV